ncbi:Centrosomal protein of 41 kDa, partial [Ophiophagus hannah]
MGELESHTLDGDGSSMTKYTEKLEEIKRKGDAAPAENNLDIAETNGKGSPEEKPASPILFINNTGAGESYRSTLQSVISGVGELDLGKGDPKETELMVPNNGPYPDCPYLLLDKNAHGKIIILYDDDERVASQAATTMCERGFENLFMLSGGRLSRGSSARDCKAVAVKSSQNLPSANPATAPLTTRSLSSSSLQSRPWR